jgi:type III restriction enzyme
VGKEGEDATRHDKWCCMMYPRLALLRDLMTDEGIIYCLRKRSGEITREIRAALQDEGYEGEELPAQKTLFRREFRRLYKPFKGKIYLPRFCVHDGRGYEGLDYFGHLVRQVKVDKFDYASVDWNLDDEMARAKEVYFRISIGQRDLETVGQRDSETRESDERVRSWLTANLQYEHFSFRELRSVVDGVMDRLERIRGRSALVQFILRDKIGAFLEEQTDRQTEAAFRSLFRAKKLCLYLECRECTFEIPQEVQLRSLTRLVHDNHAPVGRSLFDVVPEASLNDQERQVAPFIDRHPEVLWWYRNEIGHDSFAIQGYKKNRIHPDFVVQKGRERKPVPTVVVVETKGEHLLGSEDTEYKRDVAAYFEKIGKSVSWQELGKGFENATFRFQILDLDEHGAWKEERTKLLSARPNDR